MDYEITEQDRELIEAARNAIRSRYVEHWHSIGAALRASDGDIFTSIHIDANVGRIAVCAEPIAIANAVYAGKKRFDTIVAVRHPGPHEEVREIKVVSPCGMCREIISDYDEKTRVIYPDADSLKKSDVLDLLPYKYR